MAAMTQTSAAQAGPAGPVTVPGGPSRRPRQQHYFWFITVLVALAALVIGGSVQHFFDQRNAKRLFYGTQLTSTEYRFLDEETRQLALPVARRSSGALSDLGDSIDQDGGINPDGTLDVELGTGSAGPLTQIAFEVTVSSLYASTTVVVWAVRGPDGVNELDQGACLLSSTLVGPGRATADLHFGAVFVPACTPDLWRASPVSAVKPDLTLAGIPRAGQ
jgi:hypothetical protein